MNCRHQRYSGRLSPPTPRRYYHYPNERKDLVTVFIYADTDFRIKRIKKDFPDLSDNKIKDLLDKKDRERASYYNYYSDNKWGRATTYDLCLNSSNLGIEGSVKLIENYLKMYVKTSEE